MGFVKDNTLYEGLEIIGKHNGLMIIHAENDEIIKLHEKRVHEANRIDPLSFNESRPGFGEVEALRRALLFVKVTGGSAIFPHISTAEGLLEIKKAKDEGLNVYAEACPQYFTFTTDDLAKQGPYLKFSPTMHDADNMEKLWKYLALGYFDTLGSDHSPYVTEEKEAGAENIWLSPNGIPGLEVLLAVMLNGINNGKVPFERVVQMTSYNPAKIYGLPNKGAIEVGYDADLVVVDMDLEKEFSRADLKSKCQWSPYFGISLKGWPVMTMVRGTVVAKDGELMVEPGYGKYVARPK